MPGSTDLKLTKTATRRHLRKTALTLALGALVATGAAQAQSSAVGSIFGSGMEPGTVVTVKNNDTGFQRQITVDASGRYSIGALPTGTYSVTVGQGGEQAVLNPSAQVLIGGGTEVSVGAAGGGEVTTIGGVEVLGSRVPVIDVSSTDTRRVFTSERLEQLPVRESLEQVALLAPGVVLADSRYPGAASFGGSAASENAIYINGYAVTNPLTNIGSTTLPFDAIGQAQVITGGYGAEFGRSTGGVMNIVTKRGGNEWKFGGQMTYTPKGLRGNYEDIRYEHNGLPAFDGLVYSRRSMRESNEVKYGMYASGPLVKDRLFIYATGELTDRTIATPGTARPGGDSGWWRAQQDEPRWMAKLDWNINDSNLLEFTAVSDTEKETRDHYSFVYTPGQDAFTLGERTGGIYYEDGGELYIGKYTGYLSDNLTLTAVYGEQTVDHIERPFGYDPSEVYVADSRPVDNQISRGTIERLAYEGAYDETRGGRLDLEWRLGDHGLRFGYDRQDSESMAGTQMSGPGYSWRYGPCTPGQAIAGGGGAVCPGNGEYVSQYIYENGGTFKVEQAAYYIEDRWQVTDQWLLTLGIRNETFKNYNADGIVYVEQKDQWAPRIGVSWDVFGDSSLKMYGNAGRYHLAMPNNVALRGAAGSLYTNEYFSFTGIDPVTGVPLGLTALGDGPYSANREYGQAPDPRSVAAQGIKSHYQDEYALGIEKAFESGVTVGARYVYRDLKGAIDDMCDYRPAYNWAIDNGYSEETADNLGNALANCRLFNPGEANTFLLDDGTGNFVQVALTAAQLGFPKLKRSYQGIDFFVERPFDGTWFGRVDYTLSRNYGNAEGQLKSDIGQTDVGQTQDWDHPELMDFANGYLPNHRKHYIKAFGFYQATSEWGLSATMSAFSGRPKNCMGYYPDTPENEEFNTYYAYGGPYYFYCNNQPAPRGSGGNMPWSYRLDFGVTYAPDFADNRLKFGLDIFNVFDRQSAQNQIEYGENGGPGLPYSQAHRVISYSDPRAIRFSIRADF